MGLGKMSAQKSCSGLDIRELALRVSAIAVETMNVHQKRPNDPQIFDYLVVLDFEATCWGTKIYPQTQNEIIEFAAVLLHIPDGVIISTFQKYVKPTEHPVLTEFCTSLTGIQQSTVSTADTIKPVLASFDAWMKENGKKYNFTCSMDSQTKKKSLICTFATWSNWDLGTCLRKECRRKRIDREDYFNRWIDVRQTYVEFYKNQPMGLAGALRSLQMDFVGQEHCGLDDARNTALLINKMVEDGVCLANTKYL